MSNEEKNSVYGLEANVYWAEIEHLCRLSRLHPSAIWTLEYSGPLWEGNSSNPRSSRMFLSLRRRRIPPIVPAAAAASASGQCAVFSFLLPSCRTVSHILGRYFSLHFSVRRKVTVAGKSGRAPLLRGQFRHAHARCLQMSQFCYPSCHIEVNTVSSFYA